MDDLNTYWHGDGLTLYSGDCRDVLAMLPAHSVSTVVTSPPFYGLRRYDCDPSWWNDDPDCPHLSWDGDRIGGSGDEKGWICQGCSAWRGVFGNEPTVDCLGWATGERCGQCYICHTMEILRALRRVMRKDAVLWYDLDDSRSGRGGAHSKNLLLVPQRVALAAQADGWIVRSDIKITSWMPESAKDRPTDSYRTLLMMTPSARYYYDSYAVRVKGDSVNDSRYGSGRHYQEQ